MSAAPRAPAAIVMAAGAGRRMGARPKALLLRDGEPLVARQIRLLRGEGVARIVVVLGHHAGAIESVLRPLACAPRRCEQPVTQGGDAGVVRLVRAHRKYRPVVES